MDRADSAASEARAWHAPEVVDWNTVAPRLPTSEESVTQIGRGEFTCSATIVQADEVSLVRLRHAPSSVGVSVLKPGYSAVILANRLERELTINGRNVGPSTLVLPSEVEGFHLKSEVRDLLAVTFRRDRFESTIASLAGLHQEDVLLRAGALELPPEKIFHLRSRLRTIADLEAYDRRGCDQGTTGSNLASELLDIVADAYLSAQPVPTSRSDRALRPEAVVTRAEAAFSARKPGAVSMADLCAASGVSKSALYAAFDEIYGEPPLRYFHKRRLVDARSNLLSCEPDRGAVTRAALAVGLTELGRFSRDYRLLFGESPSATLARRRQTARNNRKVA